MHDRLSSDAGQRPVPPLLGAHVSVEEFGGDADQPRPYLEALGPIRGPPAERDHERVAQQVVGTLTDAPAQIAVHASPEPDEERREHLGSSTDRAINCASVGRAFGTARSLGGCGGPADMWRAVVLTK